MTLALWMAYATVLGTGIHLGSAAAARLLRRWGRPERWLWATALVGAGVVPALLPALRLAPASHAVGDVGPPSSGLLGTPRVLEVTPLPLGPDLDAWLAGIWVVLSLGMLGWIALGAFRLRTARRGGDPHPHAGPCIVRTKGIGPGVAGLLSPTIFLPAWLGSFPAPLRRWVMRHEIAHLRGHDLRLRQLDLLVRVAMPWNPAVWALSRGLGRAMETDCDRRVLRGRPDPRGYGEALITVARRVPTRTLVLGAFNPRTSSLEHRIRTMTTHATPFTPIRILGLGLLMAGTVVLACETPTPTPSEPAPDAVPEEVEAEVEAVTVDRTVDREPTFTPFTAAPDITNRAEVVAALEAAYPPELREQGIGGTTSIWFFINAEGVAEDVRIQRPSGHPELDRAALEVARSIRFSPALNRSQPVAVWVAFPITFQTR